MKKIVLPLAVLAALFSVSITSGEAVKSLREGEINGSEDPVGSVDWKHADGTIPRTFAHQPPVIPHSIEGVEIHAATNDNDCLNCHGIEGSGAPRPFKTHYIDRDGKVTQTIAARWFFCTQCHVGQADRKPLVEISGDGGQKK